MAEPVFAVMGYPRSGTSMMMEALERGGMPARYMAWPQPDLGPPPYCTRCLHGMHRERCGWVDDVEGGPPARCPCPAGRQRPLDRDNHFELDNAQYRRPDFPLGYEGTVIKIPIDAPSRMAFVPSGVRAVWMMREASAIRASMQSAFGFCPWRDDEHLERHRARALSETLRRPDVNLVVMHYERVLERPREAIEAVASVFGRDLDVAAAAAVIDPAKRRFGRVPAGTGA